MAKNNSFSCNHTFTIRIRTLTLTTFYKLKKVYVSAFIYSEISQFIILSEENFKTREHYVHVFHLKCLIYLMVINLNFMNDIINRKELNQAVNGNR